MTQVRRLRRELVLGALALLVAAAATVAVAGTHRTSAFHAHRNLLATKQQLRAEGVEGPIETFLAAEQRTLKQTAPFQTSHPGALANAMAQRG